MKRKRTGSRIIILFVIGFIAVAADLATSRKYAVEQETFRYEADFDGVTSATTKVAIVPSDFPELENPLSRSLNPSYSQIENMVRKAIELQGGLDWVISEGDDVMLKVNLVGGNSPSGQGENTDVRVIKALIKIIDEHTNSNVQITVAEGTARANDEVGAAGSVWENSGYEALLTDPDLEGIDFSLFNLNQTYDDLIKVNLGNKATAAPHGGQYYVHRRELEADVYISVPVLKIHDTGITCALKNQIGTAPGSYYGYNKMKGSAYYDGLVHDVDHRRWTTEEIVDLCSVADIDFVVVDAIMCLESYKTFRGDNQVRFNTILAGADPVAIDHACAQLMCLNPDDIAHITLAEKVGLGTNNPDQIELVGADINEVKKRVIKNDAPNGVFGQSNRSWLLSDYYNSTDMSEVLIANEAELKPVAGENGWSEPVFFFDDRIDLLSFYGGAEDIITYAFSYFTAPKTQDAELWVGTQEDMTIYLNGNEVFSFSGVNVFGDNDLYTKIVPVEIREGANSLLLKSLNQFGDYSFCLNICEPETNSKWKGNRVNGLKFFTSLADAPTSLSGTPESVIHAAFWPNPAIDMLNISFNLQKTSDTGIFIYDISGLKVAEIIHQELPTGKHNFHWNLCHSSGSRVKSGVYICTISTVEGITSQRIVVH